MEKIVWKFQVKDYPVDIIDLIGDDLFSRLDYLNEVRVKRVAEKDFYNIFIEVEFYLLDLDRENTIFANLIEIVNYHCEV